MHVFWGCLLIFFARAYLSSLRQGLGLAVFCVSLAVFSVQAPVSRHRVCQVSVVAMLEVIAFFEDKRGDEARLGHDCYRVVVL